MNDEDDHDINIELLLAELQRGATSSDKRAAFVGIVLFLGRDSDRQRRAYPYCTTLATHIKRDFQTNAKKKRETPTTRVSL